MWVPAAFRVTDEDALWEIVERHGFATLVSRGDAAPVATHAPFVVTREGGGRRLWGHIARANPQAAALADGGEVLVIFRGPDAYVSPSSYADEPNVPTWNFVVVHATGIPRVLGRDDERVRWLLERTVERYESDLDEPWQLQGPEEYLARLSRGVVAFELELTSLVGQFKLSQNHPEANRRGVVRDLGRRADEGSREIARLMAERERIA